MKGDIIKIKTIIIKTTAKQPPSKISKLPPTHQNQKKVLEENDPVRLRSDEER